MAEIYFIGGSPCSGKSTVAEILAERYGMTYFKVDEYLERYTDRGAELHYEVCKKQKEMNAEQIWMREPELQCKEEFQFYEEVFPFIKEDLTKIETRKPIITEGAAYLPYIMKKHNIPDSRYLALTPTKDFQIQYYKKREWVPYVLADCSDKEKAFSNWMERDAMFAEQVQEAAKKIGYKSIVNDGEIKLSALVQEISFHFHLN